MRVFQAAVMGSGGVGKSALTIRFVNGNYLEMYDPTIEDSYRKQFSVDGTPCLLEILDTAGIDQYLSLNDVFVRDSDSFILVFSLAQRDTLDEVIRTRERILRIKNAYEWRVPMVIVGNKADLVEHREVDYREGEELGRRWGCPYIETSARTATNILPVFEAIVRQMRVLDITRRDQQPRYRPKPKGKKCVIL